jgi:hypothetical protein
LPHTPQLRPYGINEPFSTSFVLVFDDLKDADRGDDRGGA